MQDLIRSRNDGACTCDSKRNNSALPTAAFDEALGGCGDDGCGTAHEVRRSEGWAPTVTDRVWIALEVGLLVTLSDRRILEEHPTPRSTVHVLPARKPVSRNVKLLCIRSQAAPRKGTLDAHTG
jgi:hypothetical protein